MIHSAKEPLEVVFLGEARLTLRVRRKTVCQARTDVGGVG
jgi:hypothetical protein